MKIDQLIQLLEECRGEFGGDCEVRLQTQQSWPIVCRIAGITSSSEIDGSDEESECKNEDVVYIVEGTQIGYGSKAAWNVARSS